MAANDYYHSFPPHAQQDISYYGSAGRTNNPLPPVPPSHAQRPAGKPPTETTHETSPFDDHQYPAYPKPSGQSDSPPYYGHRNSDNDPFGDGNAIPLQHQGKSNTKNYAADAAALPLEEESLRGRDRKSRRKKKDGWFRGKITWACFILFLIQLCVFIAEIVKNSILTGSPIEIHPTFNPMLGPSPYVLINMGARFTPCMKAVNATMKIAGRPDSFIPITSPEANLQCPNATSTTANCHIADLCGFGLQINSINDTPNQWYRFITPIFLHGGLIHIGFNMLLQLTLGRDIERTIGTLRFLLVYFASGIFGNVFGGNFAPNGLPSTGASGALFGIFALVLLHLLYTWPTHKNPVRDLCFILLDIVISFCLGLLPGLDNFAHIGGFLVGITLGICILRSPDRLRERIGLDLPNYDPLLATAPEPASQARAFAKQPVAFFKRRKATWWAWWLLRAGGLVLVIVAFALLLNNFYTNHRSCTWCKYLSCLPVKNWCEIGNLEFTQTPAR